MSGLTLRPLCPLIISYYTRRGHFSTAVLVPLTHHFLLTKGLDIRLGDWRISDYVVTQVDRWLTDSDFTLIKRYVYVRTSGQFLR